MKPNWNEIMTRLQSYPSGTHRLLPPCPDERLSVVSDDLGGIPTSLREMLRVFNGAEFFLKNGPLFTMFGISVIPPLPSLEWADNWYVDHFTPVWRKSSNRINDWAIGMTSYGYLILLTEGETVLEWDTSQNTYARRDIGFNQWVDGMLCEGEDCMRESD
jgi:hypothetical protein